MIKSIRLTRGLGGPQASAAKSIIARAAEPGQQADPRARQRIALVTLSYTCKITGEKP